MSCPVNSIPYNGTRCACGVGQLLNLTTNTCRIFAAQPVISTDTGVDYYTLSLPETIFSFDTIRKFTQSQAVFLEATLVMLLSWLLFCVCLRFTKLRDGKNVWFNLRWWISRLDVCFSTRHWLDDQQVVRKRKTELGGTLSIASWMLFTGLFAALLYQIITKRTIEVHNVRATNLPDLASFINDMEFNITTVSSMSCSNLRGIGTLVSGNPGFTEYRVTALSSFGSYSCRNSSLGPTINFKCNNCRLTHDYMYISWNFVDLPDIPAAAVGFQFNFTSKNQAHKKHVSFVSGTLKNASVLDGRPVTFRGTDTNILKFNLFPRIYHNLGDLKLIQPLFHEFVPGSNYHETAQLQASLGRSSDGIVNTTLFVNYLSAYVVEIDNQSILGPVSFLADLGGLYCFSMVIFFYLLMQCEYRVKKLRNEDIILRKIRSRRKAQEHWAKLRKYVAFTWGCNLLGDDFTEARKRSTFSNLLSALACRDRSVSRSGLSRKQREQYRTDSIGLYKKASLSMEQSVIAEPTQQPEIKSFEVESTTGQGDEPSKQGVDHEIGANGSTKNDKKVSDSPRSKDVSRFHLSTHSDDYNMIPLPPPVEFQAGSGSEVDMADIQRNFHRLHDYNVMLRDKLMNNQSLLSNLASKLSSSAAAESKR